MRKKDNSQAGKGEVIIESEDGISGNGSCKNKVEASRDWVFYYINVRLTM